MSRIEAQRGFSLVETMIGAGLIAAASIACCGAVASVTHAGAIEARRRVLDDDALAVLADARSITAYDAAMIARLNGRTATIQRRLGTLDETLSLRVTTSASGSPIAIVTASDGDVSLSERETLYQEAPSPGAVVQQ